MPLTRLLTVNGKGDVSGERAPELIAGNAALIHRPVIRPRGRHLLRHAPPATPEATARLVVEMHALTGMSA